MSHGPILLDFGTCIGGPSSTLRGAFLEKIRGRPRGSAVTLVPQCRPRVDRTGRCRWCVIRREPARVALSWMSDWWRCPSPDGSCVSVGGTIGAVSYYKPARERLTAERRSDIASHAAQARRALPSVIVCACTHPERDHWTVGARECRACDIAELPRPCQAFSPRTF